MKGNMVSVQKVASYLIKKITYLWQCLLSPLQKAPIRSLYTYPNSCTFPNVHTLFKTVQNTHFQVYHQLPCHCCFYLINNIPITILSWRKIWTVDGETILYQVSCIWCEVSTCLIIVNAMATKWHFNAEWATLQESICLCVCSKVPSDWLPLYIKAQYSVGRK